MVDISNWVCLSDALTAHKKSGDWPELARAEEFIDLEEAAHWIASGTFNRPGRGTQSLASLASEEEEIFQSSLAHGRWKMALEFLCRSLVSSEVQVWAELSPDDCPRNSDETERTYSLRKVVAVPKETLGEVEIAEVELGYYLDDQWFVRLMFNSRHLFENFHPSADSPDANAWATG